VFVSNIIVNTVDGCYRNVRF